MRIYERENNPNWKGGKIIFAGYIYILKRNHPKATVWNPYIKRARLVMEEYLGRILESYEQVHHTNGNKQDDRIENLQLVSQTEHDKLRRSKMIICPKCHKQNIGFHINALYCKDCRRIFTSKEGEEAGKLKVKR